MQKRVEADNCDVALDFESDCYGDSTIQSTNACRAICFRSVSWRRLFPITIGHYYGEAAAGGNYGVLYAIAKGSGGLYGGILSTILVIEHGFSFAIGIAGIMAIAAGLIIIIPLKFSPPVWNLAKSGAPGGQGGDVVERTV